MRLTCVTTRYAWWWRRRRTGVKRCLDFIASLVGVKYLDKVHAGCFDCKTGNTGYVKSLRKNTGYLTFNNVPIYCRPGNVLFTCWQWLSIQLLKSWTNYAYATVGGQNTCYIRTMWHHSCLWTLKTLNVINPLVRIRLTKINKSNYNNYPLHGEKSTTCTVHLNHNSFNIWGSQVMQLQCFDKYVEKKCHRCGIYNRYALTLWIW